MNLLKGPCQLDHGCGRIIQDFNPGNCTTGSVSVSLHVSKIATAAASASELEGACESSGVDAQDYDSVPYLINLKRCARGADPRALLDGTGSGAGSDVIHFE